MGKFEEYLEFSKKNKKEVLKELKTSEKGLTSDKVLYRLNKDGKNIPIPDVKHSKLYFLLSSCKDQFVAILVFLAIINFILGDKLGSLIILVIVLISVLIRYFQEYSVYKFNQTLKSKIYSTCSCIRNGETKTVKIDGVVVGDIVTLNAGSIVPADVYVLESQDLYVDESVFTGETKPIEKYAEDVGETDDIFEISNIILMNSTVVTGRATAVVFNTGLNTYLGSMGKSLKKEKTTTSFDIGMRSVTKLLIMYMIIVSFFVLIIHGAIKGNLNEALLFALSVAVGITPSMLPMIVNVNLTRGSKVLADKKTLVKRIDSIQNLGSMDILCTDKTGTLTENRIILQKYIDINGDIDESILNYAWLNAYYGTGLKNIVDKAIIDYGAKYKLMETLSNFKKIDEIPFDYERRKMSIVVKNGKENLIITKGALEEVIKGCSYVKVNGRIKRITKEMISKVFQIAKEEASTGMQVIALAESNKYPGKNLFTAEHEKGMTFVGFVCFLDPPKNNVDVVIKNLKEYGITTKILTGDNPYATKNVCQVSGIDNKEILTGKDIDKLSDYKLKKMLDRVNVYARLNPLQKERIIKLLREKGHVVGYMGDGVNDAPALKASDVGIAVNSGTSIAKETADIILLEKSLDVVCDGVVEGRKVYGNIIKYMKMALSDDFGDVFSIMIASIFLPFLPLLPIQMLIQDFIYDFSQIGIPYDNVDEDFIKIPRIWSTKGISRFMLIMGIASSIIDVLGFVIFWFVLGYNTPEEAAYFQTAWFIACLVTELCVIINVRTSHKPFIDSNPSPKFKLLIALSLVLTICAPILLHSVPSFNFVVLPLTYYLYLGLMVVIYMVMAAIIKKIYIKKYNEWL